MVRCSCKTESEKKCKRKVVDGKSYCWQHAKNGLKQKCNSKKRYSKKRHSKKK
jgi:hypothetical protein